MIQKLDLKSNTNTMIAPLKAMMFVTPKFLRASELENGVGMETVFSKTTNKNHALFLLCIRAEAKSSEKFKFE